VTANIISRKQSVTPKIYRVAIPRILRASLGIRELLAQINYSEVG
jgi:hypothetical protein